MGLVPWYVKDSEVAKARPLVNAMAESVAEKPTFKQALRERRCIVPASGFYEWKDRQPYCFHPIRDEVFSLAGICEVRQDAEGKDHKTFCVITTRPNGVAARIHDRMPAILTREAEAIWLDREITEPAVLLEALQPYPDELMDCYASNPLVGNVRNDGPELIRRSAEAS